MSREANCPRIVAQRPVAWSVVCPAFVGTRVLLEETDRTRRIQLSNNKKNKHLMTGLKKKSESCFPETLNFPLYIEGRGETKTLEASH